MRSRCFSSRFNLAVSSRRFTLIEILIVVAILGILVSLSLAALRKAIGKTHVAIASSMLSKIETALASYRSDQGQYPRLAPRPRGASLGDADGLRDDCVALWVGLMNSPTRQAGGGPSAPYLEGWSREHMGYYTGGVAGLGAGMPTRPDGTNRTVPLPATDFSQLRLQAFQLEHVPPAAEQLVLCDSWGNPIHYREWSSVRESAKLAAVATPVARSLVGVSLDMRHRGGAEPIPTVQDAPRDVGRYDLWSNGENGINEYGHPDSDDVTSWR